MITRCKIGATAFPPTGVNTTILMPALPKKTAKSEQLERYHHPAHIHTKEDYDVSDARFLICGESPPATP